MGIATDALDGTSPACAAALDALVEWALGTKLADILATALQRAAAIIVDDLAAAVAVRDEPDVRRYREFAVSRAGHAEATLFDGGQTRIDRFWAAAANALAMTTAEIDEGYQPAPCHAGLYTVPALMAEAEAEGVSAGALLRAQVLSYELVARIARSWRPRNGPYPVLYTHARFAAIGAACASCLVRRVEAGVLRQSIGIAATLINGGPRNHLIQGATVRNTGPVVGAWNGMMSARWAEFGITAIESTLDDVFEGIFGFEPHPQQLCAGLGRDWAVQQGYSRSHACHLAFIPLIECLLELRPRLAGRSLQDIESVQICVGEGPEFLASAVPATTLAARFSVPHLVAATLVLGHALPSAFSSITLAMPDIAALRTKARVAAPSESSGTALSNATTVEIKTADSRFVAVRSPPDRKGGEYRLSHVLEKVNGLTQEVYPWFGRFARGLIDGDADSAAEPCSALVARLTMPAHDEPPT